MQPLHELLHRIRWDDEFGRGDFALGYYDRVLDKEIAIPFSSVALDTSGRPALSFTDPDGITERIPLHRVRTVYKNGQVIWKRPPR